MKPKYMPDNAPLPTVEQAFRTIHQHIVNQAYKIMRRGNRAEDIAAHEAEASTAKQWLHETYGTPAVKAACAKYIKTL